jgi:four helix bundle protein
VANGSLMELETHLLLAGRLSYVSPSEVERLLEKTAEVSRMLAGLRKSLKNNRSDKSDT